jgi:hypothetical protein
VSCVLSMRKINWLLFTLSEDHSSFCLDKQQTIIRYSPEPGWINNRIGGVMVSLLASNAVDRGFEPRPGQTKDYKIGMYCLSAKHTEIAKTGWLEIMIMCLSGAICLSADCCLV